MSGSPSITVSTSFEEVHNFHEFLVHLCKLQPDETLALVLVQLTEDLSARNVTERNKWTDRSACCCCKCLPSLGHWKFFTPCKEDERSYSTIQYKTIRYRHRYDDTVFSEEVKKVLLDIEDGKQRVMAGYPAIQLTEIQSALLEAVEQRREIMDALQQIHGAQEETIVPMDTGGYGGDHYVDVEMEEELLGRSKRKRVLSHHLHDSVVIGTSREAILVSSLLGGCGVESAIQVDSDSIEVDTLSDTDVEALTNPILDEYVKFGKLSQASKSELEIQLPGNDGGALCTSSTLSKDPETPMQAAANRYFQAVAMRAHKHNATASSIEEELACVLMEADREDSVFRPGVAAMCPTSATKLYNMVASPHAPTTYIYDACHCGRVRRNELKDNEVCPDCKHPWPFKQHYNSIISHFTKGFAAFKLAKAWNREFSWCRSHTNGHVGRDGRKLRDFWDLRMAQAALDDEEVNNQEAEEFFSADPRNQLVFAFVDSMLTIPKDKGSDKLTVGFLGSFNPEQHIRCWVGIGLVCFVTSRMKNVDELLKIMDDEIRWLRMVGERIYDAYKKEMFTLRVKLVRVHVDSRALRQALGVAEAGAEWGCFICGEKGVNHMFSRDACANDVEDIQTVDVEVEGDSESEASYSNSISSDEEDEVEEEERGGILAHGTTVASTSHDNLARKKGMRCSKMVYLGIFRWLPLVGEWPTYLRRKAAQLHHRPPKYANDWRSIPPERRKEEAVQAAAARLKALSMHPLPPHRQARVREYAKKEAVVRYSPLLGSGMPITWSNFDFMHAISNLALLLRTAMLGYGMAEKKTGVDFLKYEQDINKRYMDVEQTTTGMKKMLYVLEANEKRLVNNRNKLIHSGHLHPDFTGGGLKHAFEEYESSNRGMHGMTCDGHISLFGPVGRYLLDGTLNRSVIGFGDEILEFTYSDMLMRLFMAINKLRLKETTVEEGKKTKEEVFVAMCMMQIALPAFYSTHVTHQVLHIAEELPTSFYAVFALERLMRTIRNKMHNQNPAQRDANVNNNVMWSHGLFVGALSREETEEGVAGAYQRLYSNILETPAATLYSRTGQVMIIPSLPKKKKMINLCPAQIMSMFLFYLVEGGRLTEMYEAFLQNNPDEIGIHEEKGLEAKEAARKRFEAWVRAQAEYSHEHEQLYIEETAVPFKRCQIGPLSLRQASLDRNRERSASYFLAEVGEGKVKVCRAAGFICHRPPGVEKDNGKFQGYRIFVLPEWLFSTTPLLTVNSKLPLVVMPDAPEGQPKWIKTDNDSAVGLIERVWPVSSIRPSSVCVLPADEKHSIPPGIKVKAKNRSAAVNQGLSKYSGVRTGVPGTANAPQDAITFRLGCVCLKYDADADDIEEEVI